MFFILKSYAGLSAGILGMGCAASPAILCGLYRRNGLYFEKYIKNMFRFLKTPRKRVYRTCNVYDSIEMAVEYEKLKTLNLSTPEAIIDSFLLELINGGRVCF